MTKIIRPREELAEHFALCIAHLVDIEVEMGMKRSESEEKALDIFEALYESADKIPLEAIRVTEEFMIADPGFYQHILSDVMRSVGSSFFPASARDYVAKLNERLELNRRNFD